MGLGPQRGVGKQRQLAHPQATGETTGRVFGTRTLSPHQTLLLRRARESANGRRRCRPAAALSVRYIATSELAVSSAVPFELVHDSSSSGSGTCLR